MTAPFATRLERVRESMRMSGVDTLLLSVGSDLPWLTGYEAMPLERLTMFVLTTDARPVLVVPRLEAPRVVDHGDVDIYGWGETEDPVEIVTRYWNPGRVAIGDTTWTSFCLALQRHAPNAQWQSARDVVGPLRQRKDPDELLALRRAAAAVDDIAAAIQGGEIAVVGQSESALSAAISALMIEAGHQRANFSIVAAGANAASPHHEPTSRIVAPNEAVLFDFGGTMPDEYGVGYCSDITRCVWTGSIPPEVSEAYAVLAEAQAIGVAAGGVDVPAQSVDRAVRAHLDAHGFGEYFIHRTGHGIGVEAHEDPYLVEGNDAPLAVGDTYSVEPGIYLPGRYGFRIEDIVTIGPEGPISLNTASHELVER